MSLVRSRRGSVSPSGRALRLLSVAALTLTGFTAVTLAQPPATTSGAAGSSAKPAKPDAASPAQDASLPSARSILDRHVAAIGGREAVLSHTSTAAKGSLSMPKAGMVGALEVYGAAPNKSVVKISLAGVGVVTEGFNGVHGWSLSPMTGPMLLEGKQLDEKRFDSDFHSELRDASRYTSMTTLERTEFEGRPCYKVQLVRKTGGQDIEFYDVVTGLKAGSITSRETHMGTVSGTTVEADYRKFGNLLQPTTIKSQISGVEQIITITSVEYDSVPASVFELPVEIRALVK
jgi:hypothetical protein